MPEPISLEGNETASIHHDEDSIVDKAEVEEGIWRVGVFDAHCHPTDIMSSLSHLGSGVMKPVALTVMSTRSQDQELVERVARGFQLRGRAELELKGCEEEQRSDGKRFVVPAFGWHPWFAYQLYDDREEDTPLSEKEINAEEHYRRVLTPSPSPDKEEDQAFLSALPRPHSLTRFLALTETRLESHPLALIGEVGLDRPARLPIYNIAEQADNLDDSDATNPSTNFDEEEGKLTPGTRGDRPLSRFRVSMAHQKVILEAQLRLAGKYRRAVSVHSVQAHGVVWEVLKGLWEGTGYERVARKGEMKKKKERREKEKRQGEEKQEEQEGKGKGPARDADGKSTNSAPIAQPPPYPPRICMHSYSGPVDFLSIFLAPSVPVAVYFSFSEVINFSDPSSASSAKAIEVIKTVPDDRILVESDLHCAGERMDGLLRDILVRVCELKGWRVEEGARRLRRNWEEFIFGKNVEDEAG